MFTQIIKRPALYGSAHRQHLEHYCSTKDIKEQLRMDFVNKAHPSSGWVSMLSSLLLLLLLLLVPNLCLTSSSSSSITFDSRVSTRVIKTKYGSLRGMQINFPSKSLQPIEAYLGLPYASPPVGKLRFMPPVTPAIWSGVRHANAFGSVCPQKLPDIRNETLALQRMTVGRLKVLQRMQSMLRNQSEDCLYLNIYTPVGVAHETTRIPVLVFIHGESYEWNAGSTLDGSVLASYTNTVVITINYRLGILGFFPSLGGRARGNFGLMDQVAALHWIQENVREFGGDEKNVTIVGHGHGAACVNFLMLSPMARGLFHRAIMQSGSALSPWALATDAIVYARNVAKVLGCGEERTSNQILECLRGKTTAEIVSIDLNVPTHLTAFGPVIDGIVIPAEPQTLMSKPNTIFANYDLIFGVTKAESYNLFSTVDERHGIDITRRDRLLRTLVRNLFNFHLQEIFLTILNEYTDWTRPFFHPISLFESLVDIFSDALVVAPITQIGLFHAKSTQRTYFYVFAHQTENGDYNPRLGCVHGQDLAYLFGAPLVAGHALGWFGHNYTRSEVTLSENFMKYIAYFARTGNPNNESDTKAVANRFDAITRWPHYDDTQQHYISFGTQTNVQDHYLAHKLSYWFHLLPQLHKPGDSVSEEHHLLEAHDNILTYDGVVRSDSISAPISFNTYFGADSNENGGVGGGVDVSKTLPDKGGEDTALNANETTTSNDSNNNDNNRNNFPSAFDNKVASDGNASFSMIVQSGHYSTALSLTIAIGCSLLILNMLVFAGIFYQKDKNRLETKLLRKKQQSEVKTKANNNNGGGGGGGHGKSNSEPQPATQPNVNYTLSNTEYCNNVPMYSINSITGSYNQRNNPSQ